MQPTATVVAPSAATLSRDVDSHIVTLLTKLNALKEHQANSQKYGPHHGHHPRGRHYKQPMSVEVWSLELWRSVAVECFATFLFSFIVIAATMTTFHTNIYHNSTTTPGISIIATSLASGLTIAAIQLVFGPISGGHVNPAVSVSFALSRKISTLRAALYIAAQCGGGVAGATMLYGVTSQNYTMLPPNKILSDKAPLKLLVEFSLSIFVILAHYATDSPRALSNTVSGKPAAVLAAAYSAATFVSVPYLNPARALGVSFVTNKWDDHWVNWLGPIFASMVAMFLNDFIMSNNRPKNRVRESRDYDDGENSSMNSDPETYDDVEKQTRHKFPGGYATYRPVAGATSIYGGPLERVESIYGGTKSLYCKSPPLTRANLNRSQSVYAKSTSGGIRDGLILPKPGPLVPAQSLYPIRLNALDAQPTTIRSLAQNGSIPQQQQQQQQQQQTQPPQQQLSVNLNVQPVAQNHNSTNQNMQNQLQQCTQNIYGVRIGSMRDTIYGQLGTRNSETGSISSGSNNIYGRAPAPPPSNHGPSSQQIQQVQPMQQLPTRENGHLTNLTQSGSPSPHQMSSTSSQDGSRRGQSVVQSAQIDSRSESMYGPVRRSGDDSAYGTYGSSGRGIYGKTTGPPPPPHGYQVRSSQSQQPHVHQHHHQHQHQHQHQQPQQQQQQQQPPPPPVHMSPSYTPPNMPQY